jgi:hypothetical protein
VNIELAHVGEEVVFLYLHERSEEARACVTEC